MASAKIHAALDAYVKNCRELSREKAKPAPDVDKRAVLARGNKGLWEKFQTLLDRETGNL